MSEEDRRALMRRLEAVGAKSDTGVLDPTGQLHPLRALDLAVDRHHPTRKAEGAEGRGQEKEGGGEGKEKKMDYRFGSMMEEEGLTEVGR